MAIDNSPFARIKKPLKSDMNVVPYIDVMLVLLIIFMVAAPMLTTGVEVNLPQAKADNINMTKDLPVIVSLKENGDLFYTNEKGGDEQVDEEALIAALTALQTKNNNLTVLINADQNNQYGSVMVLMSLLKQSGISKVGLLTKDPEK